MKNFILRIIAFVLLVITVIAGLVSSTNYMIRNNVQLKIPNTIDKLVVGNSHPECAFNDSLIQNFENFSFSAESYFYNYFKIAELLKQNKTIKTIFIEYSNNQICQKSNNWIWGDTHLQYAYSKYAPFMGIADNYLLFKNNSSGFFNSLSILVKKNIPTILHKDFNYKTKFGGYRHLVKNKIDSMLTLVKENKLLCDTSYGRSVNNLSYLAKIISHCKTKNVTVYLIRSPLHKKYPGGNNEKFFKQVLNSQFATTEFLDFKDFPLEDAEFADLEHLNFKGAKKFSVFFNDLLKNGLLKNKSKQQFINSKMGELKAGLQNNLAYSASIK